MSSILVVLAALGAPDRVYDFLKFEDVAALGEVLRTHVAHVDVELVPEPDTVVFDSHRDGFGVVLERDLVAILSFTVENASRVRITGPGGKALDAHVILIDHERRVALLRATASLESVGLHPVKIAPAKKRARDLIVFAIAATEGEASVLQGYITDDGKLEEMEGYPHTNLALRYGMPVFDAQARFVGYSRTVAWDNDAGTLVPWDKIKEARTATGTKSAPAAAPEPPAWWTKKEWKPERR